MQIKKLLHDNVLVDKDQQDSSKGGILLPDSYNDGKDPQGEVVYIGLKVTQVKVGDKIIFPKFKSHEITIGDKEYTLVTEDKIVGVID
jgi:chaperonin GroES